MEGVVLQLLTYSGSKISAPTSLLHLGHGVAMGFRQSCNELCRSHRCCVGVSPELQWNFAEVVSATPELRRGCNGVSPDTDGAAMRATSFCRMP